MGEKPRVWGPEHGGQGEAGGAAEARARPLQPLRSRRSWSCTATAWPAWRACALTRLLPFSTWGWATTNCWAPPRAAMSPENTGNVGPRVGGGEGRGGAPLGGLKNPASHSSVMTHGGLLTPGLRRISLTRGRTRRGGEAGQAV